MKIKVTDPRLTSDTETGEAITYEYETAEVEAIKYPPEELELIKKRAQWGKDLPTAPKTADWHSITTAEKLQAIEQDKATWYQIECGLIDESAEVRRACEVRVIYLSAFVFPVLEKQPNSGAAKMIMEAIDAENKPMSGLLKLFLSRSPEGYEVRKTLVEMLEVGKVDAVLEQLSRELIEYANKIDPVTAELTLDPERMSPFNIIDRLSAASNTISALFESLSEGEYDNLLLIARDILRDELRRREEKSQGKSRRERAPLPDALPHYTFREAKNPALAIADAGGWAEVKGETALMYAREGEPLQTKLTAGANLDWWDAPANYDDLRGELLTLGPEGVFCFNVALSLVLQERHATFALDDLAAIIGWTPRSAVERETMRRGIFRWLSLFDNLTVHGNRGGKYTDKLTKQTLDTTIHSKLFMISEMEYATGQTRLDGSEPPVRITLTAGPWLERFRGDSKFLPYLGNLLKLSGLPTGQAHGEWALSVGMALNQLWREQASRAEVLKNGDDNREIVKYRPFTRHDLLSMFPPKKFSVDEILKSDRPKRAQEYWDKAIKTLKNKQISHYEELTKKPLPRQGWQNIWLHQQKFDIRPTGEARAGAVEISNAKNKLLKKVKSRANVK